jgi:hypothetical protein
VIKHGEIQAVGAFDIDQLLTRGIAYAGTLYLDNIGAQPCQ